jgi:hypothetical protein
MLPPTTTLDIITLWVSTRVRTRVVAKMSRSRLYKLIPVLLGMLQSKSTKVLWILLPLL